MMHRVLFWALRKIASKRPPDFEIWDSEEVSQDEVPYLLRWWLLPRNPYLNFYLHCFLRSDKDVPHDHPWWSLSYMLKGHVTERRPGHEPRVLKAGNLVLRSAEFAHQIVVSPEILAEGGAWTLFITGPNVRPWGFHCPKGWKHWKDFVAAGDKGRPGAGCGEE